MSLLRGPRLRSGLLSALVTIAGCGGVISTESSPRDSGSPPEASDAGVEPVDSSVDTTVPFEATLADFSSPVDAWSGDDATDSPATIDAPPEHICIPTTCAALGFQCDYAPDGCGGLLPCGTCPAPQFCGGGGFKRCGGPCLLPPSDGGGCTPASCAAQGIACGPAGDGCGGLLQCGPCPTPETCGGGGIPGQCGPTDGGCQPLTCADLGFVCGQAGDGCGSLIDCGHCTPPQTCGGGGVPGQCDVPEGGTCCVPQTCSEQNVGCGPTGDGCGGILQCGTCSPPSWTCGGGGYAQCG